MGVIEASILPYCHFVFSFLALLSRGRLGLFLTFIFDVIAIIVEKMRFGLLLGMSILCWNISLLPNLLVGPVLRNACQSWLD